VESANDLAALNVVILSPRKRLASLRSERRRIIAESAVMVSYVAGRRPAKAGAIGRLVRGIDRQGGQSLGLPALVLRCPVLLRALEPIRPGPAHRLAQRLHLAAMVVESMPEQHRRLRSNIIFLIGQMFVELVALPFRYVLGALYA
jgi:hypothetical protein